MCVSVEEGFTPLALGGDADLGGAVYCWGANYAGQSAVPVKAKRWMISVVVGWEHTVRYPSNVISNPLMIT